MLITNDDVKELIDEPQKVEKLLSGFHPEHLEVIEFITWNEGKGYAVLVLVPFEKVSGAQEAMLFLLYALIHCYEDWDINTSDQSYILPIYENFLRGDLKTYSVEPMTTEEYYETINLVINPMIKYIKEKEMHGGDSYDDSPGIYSNKIRTKEAKGLDAVTDCVWLFNEWNDIDVFYKTSTHFAWLSWHTTA